MDDFEDDDFGAPSGSTSKAGIAQQTGTFDDDDDFGDFRDDTQAGQGGLAGDGDDDFGDFDSAAAATVGPSSSSTAGAPAQSTASAQTQRQRQTETGALPELNDPYGVIVAPPDFAEAFASAPAGEDTLTTLRRIVDDFFAAAYPGVEEAIYTDDPIPVPDPEMSLEDILLGRRGESSLRETYEKVIDEPQRRLREDKRPWEWKRSKVRLNAMRELGLPVNLDDVGLLLPEAQSDMCIADLRSPDRSAHSADDVFCPTASLRILQFADPPAKPMAPLVLPSIKTTLASPPSSRPGSSSASASAKQQLNGKSSSSALKSPISRSASPSASSAAKSPSGSRSSTPAPAPAPAHSMPALPPIDLERCTSLAKKSEQELSFMSVEQLNALREDLQKTAVDASNHLRGLLERKEMLQGQNETYNAMIQVSASHQTSLLLPVIC